MSRRWVLIAVVALALSVLVDALTMGDTHEGLPWRTTWGGYALFGLVSSIVLVLGAKALGHYVLEREEDYYERDRHD